jgi:hypothetical protein
LRKLPREPRRSRVGSPATFVSRVAGSAGTATGAFDVVAVGDNSSAVEVLGLPELPRLPPKKLFLVFVGEEPSGGEALPFEIPPMLEWRVRSANSDPMGASFGTEDLSVPRVRPMPAFEEDMRRKSMAGASAGM